MSKQFAIVVGFSIVLISLFCTFSYLMTTVNPDPIIVDETLTVKGKGSVANSTGIGTKPVIIARGTAKGGGLRVNIGVKPDNHKLSPNKAVLQNNVKYVKDILTQKIGPLRYGLEKAELDESDESLLDTSEFLNSVLDKDLPQNNSEPTNQTEVNGKTRQKVAIPVLKIEKRSSVDEIETKKGAIVFKIVDDTGRTKIEIKIEADAFEVNNKCQKCNNSDIVISIMPNNSLTLDECDESSLILDFHGNNEVVFKVNRRTLEVVKNVSATTNEILQTLIIDKLVLYKAVNNTKKIASPMIV